MSACVVVGFVSRKVDHVQFKLKPRYYLDPWGADGPRGAWAAGGTFGLSALLCTRVVGGVVFILQNESTLQQASNNSNHEQKTHLQRNLLYK